MAQIVTTEREISWMDEMRSFSRWMSGRYWGVTLLSIFMTIASAIYITERSWIYLGALFVPLLIYLMLEKPFVFPFGAYVFLLPFDQLLSVSGSPGGPTLTKYLGILSIIVFLLKGLHERKLSWPANAVTAWLLLCIYGIVSVFWAVDPSLVMSRLSTVVGLFVLYLVVGSYRIDETEFALCKWFILLGGVLAALIGIYNYSSGIDFMATNRFTLSVGGETTDPNTFAFSLMIPIAICVDGLLKPKSRKTAIMHVLALITILFGVLLTGSRGGMVGIGVIFFVYVLFIRKRVTLLSVLVLASIVLLTFVPGDFIVNRWANTVDTGGAGRLYIWYAGLRALSKYGLTGAGLNNFPVIYAEFGYFTPFTKEIMRGAHNQYLETAVELGIVGFAFMALAIWKHYRLLRVSPGRFIDGQVMLKAVFWSMLTSSFFLGTMWSKSFWLIWMMILMYNNVSKREPF